MEKVIKGGEPFEFTGTNDCAVLLLHGFTGSPASVLLMGKFLFNVGYSVMAPLLAGHGINIEALQKTNADDWYGSALEAYKKLRIKYAKVVVLGVSMGGLLALRLGAQEKPDAVISIATPIFLYDWRVRWAWLFHWFLPYVAKRPHIYPAGEEYNIAYLDHIPTKPVASMWNLVQKCRNEYLSKINCPILIEQSKADATVRFDSAQYIYDNCASVDKKLYWFNNSGHLLILDKDRKEAMEQIENFLNERMALK